MLLCCNVANKACFVERVKTVGMATRYALDGPVTKIPMGGEIFRTRPDLPWGPPSLLYNGYRFCFPGVKRPGRGVNHPHISNAEVKERVEVSSTPSQGLRGLFQGEFYLYLYHTTRVQTGNMDDPNHS